MTTKNQLLNSLSLVIPAYNDQETIGRLIDDSAALLNEICSDYEIVVTNDGSKDNTWQIMQDRAKANKKIRLINHEMNKGFGFTIRELYYAANKELVFSLPGDYQYSPNELLKMAKGLASNDFVIGLRIKRNDPWRRKLQSNIYNFMLRIVYGHKHTDVNSIKLFKRKILDRIQLNSTTAFVDAEFCIKAEKAGFRVVEIPIDHLPRLSQGASGGKLSVIAETFGDLLKMRSTI